ncbi:AAA family ATPase [Candidatus Gracilibacteria bacterium]|nr:AAA family ATPase [Candidatus Gracilibacteria bacterium]PIQ12207.1 MAG: hypothetical protein COW68_00470 [Candidatus Gracilibacteria bacterium CG18_big_fil_WC_8_21_14_2_50_38_16]PIQ40941.1 MAG: hypothetical protein COW06_04430 [Candidatus Gracilibacteria bacterium CG12_big_fil_rev_8_21_14_0_65_38_15]PIZ01974.1 MAG: hypothetical protein COY60_00645 [Candidatus Gracilibacteria bacterium CG_4_10_14_0_8_um_filter_38_28]
MNRLIIVFGLPGSGKSTVANIIHEYFGEKSIILRTDEIRQELFPKSLYTQDESDNVYAEFYRRTNHFLNIGKTVILDGVFAKQSERDSVQVLGEKMKTNCHFIHVISDEQYIKERLNQRKGDVSEANYEVYLKLKSYFEKVTGKYITIDNSGNIGDLKVNIFSFLSTN